jgi:hypothetical protein
MSDDERPPHAVLVRSPEKFSAPGVAAVLGKRSGRPALDFTASARRAWGLVAESLPAAEAEALAAALTEAGQPALAAPSSLLESPPPPVVVTKAEFSGDGFDVVAGRANAAPERLSWNRLRALCAAGFEQRTSMTVTETDPGAAAEKALRLGLTLATGIPMMKRSEQKTRVVESRDRSLAVDLLFVEPSRRVRVNALGFDYGVLGEKKSYASELNFMALLNELRARAPKALLGRGTRALLSRRPAAESAYESEADLEREERWLLSLCVLQAAE